MFMGSFSSLHNPSEAIAAREESRAGIPMRRGATGRAMRYQKRILCMSPYWYDSQVFCPNLECMARGQIGQGNIVSHGREPPRYRCKTCGKTFSAKEGTLFAGLRKPMEVIVTVVTLLAYGCPIQAIVHAFG